MPAIEAKETCSTCRYWLPATGAGTCVRYPPSLNVIAAEYAAKEALGNDINSGEIVRQALRAERWVFPRMKDEDWCGEWSKKP